MKRFGMMFMPLPQNGDHGPFPDPVEDPQGDQAGREAEDEQAGQRMTEPAPWRQMEEIFHVGREAADDESGPWQPGPPERHYRSWMCYR